VSTQSSKTIKEGDEQLVNNASSRLNPYKLELLIWDLTDFILVNVLPITFNCTHIAFQTLHAISPLPNSIINPKI
jgi:hypothetical protein